MLATSVFLPIIQRILQASVNYWLFTKAKGGNKSPQYYLTALEINTSKHNALLHLGLLESLGVLHLLVLNH